ncbi:MAG: carboxypeptidase regulatory-like domain-containing protein [Bacillota bacterium]
MFYKNDFSGMNFTLTVIVLICLFCILPVALVQAHGVELEYIQSNAVVVIARYDSGAPMAEAQVAVFAPGSPAEPWLTGACDSEGRFFFIPDPDMPGLWEVQVRQAGHGGLLRIEVGENGIDPVGSTGFSGPQILIMTAAVVWGLIGTALYFSRRKS